jgi:hypothetical protein
MQRAVIAALCTVTIAPAGRGARVFDSATVTFDPEDHKRRVREAVTVQRHPSGWISTLGHDDPQTCNAVFDYAHARKLDDFKAFHAGHPVIWKCHVHQGRRGGTQYFCDSHLPAEFRPEDETITEGNRP